MYTYGTLYKLFQDLWDKAGNPYMPKTQFDRICSMKYSDFVTDECEKIEVNQEHKNQIHDLYVDFNKSNSDAILFPTDISNYRYLVRFYGIFKNPCGGADIKSAIYPATNNEIDVLDDDPFNKPDNNEPLYIPTVQNGVKCYQVFSETPPLQLFMTYVRDPSKIDSALNPNTRFELPDDCAEQIIRSMILTSDIIIEQYQRAQFEGAEQAKLDSK